VAGKGSTTETGGAVVVEGHPCLHIRCPDGKGHQGDNAKRNKWYFSHFFSSLLPQVMRTLKPQNGIISL
jgi:hypothetical protein